MKKKRERKWGRKIKKTESSRKSGRNIKKYGIEVTECVHDLLLMIGHKLLSDSRTTNSSNNRKTLTNTGRDAVPFVVLLRVSFFCRSA